MKGSGSSAAGPAPVNNNNNFLPEIIASIKYSDPNPATTIPHNLFFLEKLKELLEMDKDILNISISKEKLIIVSCAHHQGPDRIELFIYFKNFSESKKKNKDFEEKIDKLIRLLIYFKEAAKIKLYDTEFEKFSPDDEYFTPEYNEFLKFLATKI